MAGDKFLERHRDQMTEERLALEREVNNGGYRQFLLQLVERVRGRG